MTAKGWACAAISLLIIGVLTVAVVSAGTVMPDVAAITAPYEHTRNVVDFTHKKHIEEYKINCGECHHDDQNKPLTNLKEGDDVKPCFECHNKPGELTGKAARGLSDKEKLAYHANAVHENCIDCHRKHNRELKKKVSPQTCNDCHPKGKKGK